MSAPKRVRDDESAGAAAGGAGGPPPLLPPEANLAVLLLSRDVGFGNEPLSLVVAFLAPRDQCCLAATCRATWRCILAGLSAYDADRVRRDHPLWQAIIDIGHGGSVWKMTQLGWAAYYGHLARVRELCDWCADIEAADKDGRTPLWWASNRGHLDIVRELLSRGANVNAARDSGRTPLMSSSCWGHADVVRALLAAGADKRHVANNGDTAVSLADVSHRTAILALLAAAP